MPLIAAVTVTMDDPRSGKPIWWFVEFPDVADMAELDQTLIEDGTIFGNKLKLEPIGDGRTQRRVVGREEIIIGKSAVATITPTHIEIIG
jgi:hypothetical protein